MKSAICGAACEQCGLHALCKGCAATCGKPFGKTCWVARYIQTGGAEALEAFKQRLAEEVNDLRIPGLPQVTAPEPVNGRFVNLSYRLPGGQHTTFLQDDAVYLCCHLPCEWDESSTFCVVAAADFLLVSLCGAEGQEGELLAYRRR